jgi:ABC-type lipoprotein release transport system permease subunit
VTVEEAVGGLALRLENTPYRVRTRAEKNALITKTNRAEKWATFAILSFILIVAAFNVMASLTMLLLDKRGDIEVLQALGFTGRRLERAFSLQGLLINTIGGLGGAGIGLLLVKGQERYGWLKLEGSVVPAYPVALEWLDVAGVLAVVLLIGGLGSALMVRVLVRRMTSMRWAV